MSGVFEQDFEQLLRQYETALDDKKKFTALVKDLFPDQAKTVNLLLMAYNMGIAGPTPSFCTVISHFLPKTFSP